MKARIIICITLLFLVLGACADEQDTFTVTLLDRNEEVLETFTADENDTVFLPVLEEEGLIFIGWGEDLSYKEITVTEDLTLLPKFENPEDVFTIEKDIGNTLITYITGYNGRGKYIRIPEWIGDDLIGGIATHAFLESELIEVEIPNTVQYVNEGAFKDSRDLRKVSFYGGYAGLKSVSMLKETYEEIIADHASVCTVVEDEGNRWTLSEGCPVVSVDHANSYGEIDGVMYLVYETTVDLAYYDEGDSNLLIKEGAFSGLSALETIEFPERYGLFQPWIFSDTPSLVELVFDGNENYEVTDGIVYDEKGEKLLYYPSGLNEDSFLIPDHVIGIGYDAFKENTYLESVTIPLSVEIYRVSAFNGTSALKRIEVVEGHESLYDDDGVLFSTNKTLLRYPSGREDDTYVVPDGTIIIAPYAFHGQQHVKNVVFPSSLTHLGYYAFSKVQEIEMLDLPASVEWIDTMLTYESSIEKIIIRTSGVEQDEIAHGRFSWYDNMPIVYVPDDSLDLYRDSTYWHTIAFWIEPYSAFEE